MKNCKVNVILLVILIWCLPAIVVSWADYVQLKSFADNFMTIVQKAHDTNKTETHRGATNATCDKLISFFENDSIEILNSNLTFNPLTFCHIWDEIPVYYHQTQVNVTLIEPQVVNNEPPYQTIGFVIQDIGELIYNNCSFNIPNVAWARISLTTKITYFEFVTDADAFIHCF